MGGAYSAEEIMQTQMLDLRLLENNGNALNNVTRRPFKLIRDNGTQTDANKDDQCKCSCSDGKSNRETKASDESHINFTSIYLSCHSAPSKCFCENFVQTDPVSVTSLAVQTEDVSVGAGCSDSAAGSTNESSESDQEDRLAYRQQWKRRRRSNAMSSLKSQILFTQTHHSETKGGQCISSFSDDDSFDDNHYVDDSMDEYDSAATHRSNVGALDQNLDQEFGIHDLESDCQEVLGTNSLNIRRNLRRYSASTQNIELATNMWQKDMTGYEGNRGYLSDDNYTRKSIDAPLIKRDGSGCNLDRFTDQETGIEEEFEIRHMLDVDYCWKCESLQQENKSMKETVTHYEHVIKELSDQSEDLMLTDATLNDAINEKEQLQLDLNKAESSLMDAYKRIERLKSALDKYKHNESTMKVSLYDFQTKLSKSEERYKKLKQQASEKVNAANTEIARVHTEKEMELGVLQTEFEKCCCRNTSLEDELEEKNLTNKELSQICDELIKKVSDE